MIRRWHRLPDELRSEVLSLAAQGVSKAEIVRRVDVSIDAVRAVLRPLGHVGPVEQWQPRSGQLTLDDRVEIRVGVEVGRSVRQIACALGRSPSTVSRELTRNGGRDAYRPFAAHHLARVQARRPKSSKLSTNPALLEHIEHGLERLWSPQQISQRLRTDFSDDPGMHISHETIYQSLYVQGRGELRRDLARCLRSGRTQRKPRGRLERRGRIPDQVMISERPAEVEDRAVPGHWEGDLILGANQRSAIGTLVERTTRFVMLLHLPDGHGAAQVRDAMTTVIQTLPEALRRSITWDQGKEMAAHAQFTVDTGVQIYFCDPYKPWQRGTNENTNGLLRQYFPKGTDLSQHTDKDLQAAADSLNDRPRQTLGWMTPSEKLAELLAVAPTA